MAKYRVKDKAVNTSNKIEKILDAAEEVMSEKGLQNSSIAEIAKKAEVADSLIYNYFKGKEDLLFSIPKRRMKEVLKNLSEQLEGILDPVSKLSKMIKRKNLFDNQFTLFMFFIIVSLVNILSSVHFISIMLAGVVFIVFNELLQKKHYLI